MTRVTSVARYSRLRLQRAFTVIELLVAATITIVIAGLMLALVGNVLTSWNRSHGTLETEAQARLALDQLAQDLQGAMFRNDGGVWLAASIPTDTTTSGLWKTADFNAKPSTVTVGPALLLNDAHFGVAGVWLRLIAARPASTASGTSAPVAVGYQLLRMIPPSSGTATTAHYLLFRAEVSAANTFAAGYNLDPTTGAVGYRTANQTEGDAGNLLKPPTLRFIADNVVDFGVRLYTRDSATGSLTLVFPATAADRTHLAKSPPTATTAADRFPEVADVMIRVLTPQGVQQIAALESNSGAGDWWAIATANSRVFTRRVVLNPSPL